MSRRTFPNWDLSLTCGTWIAPAVVFVGLACTADRPADHHHSGGASTQGLQAETYDRMVEEKLKPTYPATAMRMLAECGNVRQGVCIDLGCGGGQLDVELAKRSDLTIVGLDIDPDMKPIFEKRMKEAGLEKRVTFVTGDAQKLPFPDAHADLIVSRGMLIFVPDIGKCLREVRRVLKPTGVAFLGGRYLYAPEKDKMTTEAMKKIVVDSGVPGALVIDSRGQWVKITGPQSPPAARDVQMGPQMVAWRVIGDYGITQGEALVVCRADGPAEQGLQQGLVENTELRLVALYPNDQLAQTAAARIQKTGLDKRITCKAGDVQKLPFEAGSFHLAVGLAGVPFWKDREKAMAEVHRVLKPGGAALFGGMYRNMPQNMRVPSEQLRENARRTGLETIRVIEDGGQWVEIRKKAE